MMENKLSQASGLHIFVKNPSVQQDVSMEQNQFNKGQVDPLVIFMTRLIFHLHKTPENMF